MKNYALLSLWAFSLAAQAGPFTILELPISYQGEPVGNVSHGQECKVDDMLLRRLTPGLYTNPPTGDIPLPPPEVLAPLGDARLRVRITHAFRVEGFAMSGHRYVGIQAEISEKGRPSRQTQFMKVCNVVGMGAFSKCNIFESCADSVALDLLRWVKNPGYQVRPGPVLKDLGKIVGAGDVPAEPEK